MTAPTTADLSALADILKQALADVAKTAASLEQRIAAEGLKVGNKLGVQHAKAADERIRDNAHELQRAQDLVAEMRRQMPHLERHARTGFALEKRIREVVKVANERGEGVPAQVLLNAIAEAQAAGRQDPNQPAPKPARIEP